MSTAALVVLLVGSVAVVAAPTATADFHSVCVQVEDPQGQPGPQSDDEVCSDEPVEEFCEQTGGILPPCDGSAGPVEVNQLDPDVEAHVSISVSDCSGNKEKVQKEEWETNAGVASGGPITIVWVSQTYTKEEQGYQWQFECTLTVHRMEGECWNGFDRRCVWYANTDGGDAAEASCYYTGLESPISDSRCFTGSTHEGDYLVSFSGKTWGYPTEAQGCANGEARNEPAHNAAGIFVTVKDSAPRCDQGTISWKTPEGHLLDQLGNLI